MSNAERLPCRGCLRSCKNYATCKGLPWRIKPEGSPESNSQTDAAKGVDAKLTLVKP